MGVYFGSASATFQKHSGIGSEKMANQNWKESMKSFWRQIDPDMEERLKWTKIGNSHHTPKQLLPVSSPLRYYQRFWDHHTSVANKRSPFSKARPQPGMFSWRRVHKTENKLKKCLKLVKSINQNREGNMKKKTELTHLLEDINNEYQSIYALYDDLTSEVRRSVILLKEGESSSSSSSSNSNSDSDSEYYTPKKADRNMVNSEKSKKDDNDQDPEISDSEGDLLKDKLTSTSEIKKIPDDEVSVDSGLVIKDIGIQDDLMMNTRQKLQKKEEELLFVMKKNQVFEDQKLAEIMGLQDNMAILKLELDTISMSKKEVEAQVDQAKEESSRLKVRIAQLEQQFKEKENELYTLIEKLEEDKKGLQDNNNLLQKELEFVSNKKSELESQLKNKSEELSESPIQIGNLREKLQNKGFEKDLEVDICTLSRQKKDLENQILSTKSEAYHLRVETERLYSRIFVLEMTIREKENELSALQERVDVKEKEMSTRVQSLTEELQALQDEKNGLQMQLNKEKKDCSKNLTHTEKENVELTNKIADQKKSMKSLENVINKLTEEKKQVQSKLGDAKSHCQLAERKMEEMAEEFFKKCEDSVRILSRRIQVAEQLHIENKEWYLKTRERYEEQNKELKERVEKNEIWLSNIKEISLTADKTLSTLDGVALKFEGSMANFMNRISKVSCELKFAKDWIMRKNKAMVHVRDDLHCLLAQLDDKESEILMYRERLWKSENKIRELEKLMNEKEEGMMALEENKREAIRQLCVWIDYHRSHSDHYKKILSDINAPHKKTR